jgi:hypothetical protein
METYRRTASAHQPLWCASCSRAHNGTRDDARAIVGERGTFAFGASYAWCAREGLYHYTLPRAFDAFRADDVMPRNGAYQGRERDGAKWRDRTHQPRRDVRTIAPGTREHERITCRLASYAASPSQRDNAMRAMHRHLDTLAA